MNAQYLGDWDVAPRGRERRPARRARRRPARRRAVAGAVPPHARHARAPPRIDERHQSAVQLDFDRPTPVYLDGQRLDDPGRTLSIRVEPDALLCVV